MTLGSKEIDIGCDNFKLRECEWNCILEKFVDSTIYQTYAYGSVRWSEKSIEHIVLKKQGDVIAAAQVIIKKMPLLNAGIAYIPWGPLWKKKNTEINTSSFELIIEAVKKEYALKKGLLVRIAPNIVESDSKSILDILTLEGFVSDSSKRYRTFILNIEAPLNEIRKKLDQKWRNQLNRAEKNNLRVKEGYGDSEYKIFLDLQNEMQQRKKYVPGVDYFEFRRIQNELPNGKKMKIFICESDGKPVSVMIGSKIGDRGIYLLGATSDEGMKTKGSYLLQWKFIEWLKESGGKYYDLGGIDPDSNPGVYHFKAGLNGIDVSHIGQYEYCANRVSASICHMYEKLRSYKTT